MEFAFVAPLLFFLVLGLIEFGRVMMVQQVLTNAAREGARKAVLANSTDTEVRDTVNDYAASAGISGHTITITPTLGSNPSAGDPIEVKVRVPYGDVSLVGKLGLDRMNRKVLFIDFSTIGNLKNKTLSATVVMRKEANNN